MPNNPPFLVATYATTFSNNTSPVTLANVVTNTGDVLVVVAGTGDQVKTINTPTGGTGLSWTLQQSVLVAAYSTAYVWTATETGAGQTFTMSLTTNAGTTETWGYVVYRFSGSSGVGNSGSFNSPTTGAPDVSVTTAADNSAVVVFSDDWATVNGTTRTWDTVNSVTPTAGNGYEKLYDLQAGQTTNYSAYWPDAGTAGLQHYGLSVPSTQKYSIVGVEVKGSQLQRTTGGRPSAAAVNRASRW